MLLSVLSFLVVAQSSSEYPEGLMNNPVFCYSRYIDRQIFNWLCEIDDREWNELR